MARTYDIELAGKPRRLAFHQRDAIALKKRFNETPHTLLFKHVLGVDFAALKPGQPARTNPGLFDPEVQFAVLHLALVRGGWPVTEEKVIDYVDAAVQASDGKLDSGEFIVKAARCALYSGAITGEQVDLEAEPDENAAPPAADAEGKAPASGDAP